MIPTLINVTINDAIGFGVVMGITCGVLFLLKLKQEGYFNYKSSKPSTEKSE